MTDHDLTLEPATADDRRYVESLLERNGLPTADLDPERDALSIYVCLRGAERESGGFCASDWWSAHRQRASSGCTC